MTAGEINAKPQEHPQAHAKVNALFEVLGKMWETDESEYDKHVQKTPCPFLIDKSCSIYEIRPEGCRLFPKTAFGLLTQDCEPLNRFKKMRAALKKGRTFKEKYYFTGTNQELIKPTKFTEKLYQTCLRKLQQAGTTEDELNLFNSFNGQNKSKI